MEQSIYFNGHQTYSPKRRELNDDNLDDFVALDFETMTRYKTSACAIGMVKVLDGEIVQEFYSLLNPIRDEFTDSEPNRVIHGIPLEAAEKSNTFGELFENIRLFIGNLPIVCHNKSVDIAILDELMEYYGCNGINTENAFCTYNATGKSLEACCELYGIPNTDHHNALWDASVCARIYLELIGKPLIKTSGKCYGKPSFMLGHDIKKEHRHRLDDSEVADKSTVFYNATVVITGTMGAFPDRDNLAETIQRLGARVTSSISKKTNIVIVGDGAGPSKLKKVYELNDEGCNIRIIREFELVKILK